MKGLGLNLVACVCCLSILSGPAQADVGPGPYVPPRPRPTGGVLQWFANADAALAASNAPAFEALCAPRGYAGNLLGAGGMSLKALYGDMKARGLRLVPDRDKAAYVNFGEVEQTVNAVVISFELRERGSEVVVERLVMLIEHRGPITNDVTWRGLAVGSDWKEVWALARREFPRQVVTPEILR